MAAISGGRFYHVFRFGSSPFCGRICSRFVRSGSNFSGFPSPSNNFSSNIGGSCSRGSHRFQPKVSIIRKVSSKSRKMPYNIVERGTTNTTDYRIYFKNADNGAYISPFHDVPLVADSTAGLFNMVVEIPRWTNEKMEISRDDPLNPIKQDIKKGNLRFVPNVFPHHGYIWNYGALPQTWENPEVKDEHTGYNGDNDPIDAIEIGYRIAKRGEVLQVKVLGVIALIDEGETDWKIVTINKNDPLFDTLKDINDVDKHLPGLLKATVEWLRIYKIPDGKPENQFAFNGEFKDKAFATKIIQETHTHWKNLISRDEAKINLMNTSLNDGKNTISAKEADQIVQTTPPYGLGGPISDTVGKWHYVQLK